MKRYYFLLALLCVAFNIHAQNGIQVSNPYYLDGLHVSNNFYTGTARSMSLGNAVSALGGDISSVAINPAAIGVYRTSEFVLTPSYNVYATSSNYLSQKHDNTDYKFGLNNIGGVLTFNMNTSGWVSMSVAGGYNMINNLTNSYYIEGQTKETSFTNELINRAGNQTPDKLSTLWELPAFNAILIDTVTSAGTLKYQSEYSNQLLLQNHHLNVNGSIGEYFAGMGFNFDNQLYLGVTVNLKSGFYDTDYIHKEEDVNKATSIDSYVQDYWINTAIRGTNVKLGAIYRPVETIRIGLSIHTPTITYVSQEYNTSLTLRDKGGKTYYDVPNYSQTEDYIVTTPLRAIVGLAYMFQQFGLVSADYEYADYSSVKLSEGSGNYTFDSENNATKTFLRKTNNFRLGAEAKMNAFYLRGGYSFYQSPYVSSELNKNANTYMYAGGIGFRSDSFFADFGYSILKRSEFYYMYFDDKLSAATLKTNKGTFLATFGFKF